MMIYAQTRILFTMSRDGLLPERLSNLHPRFHTPHVITVITGVFVAVVAGLFSVDEIAELSNTGTLFAFVVVAVAVVVLRWTQPDRRRPFRTPIVWLVGPAAVIGCLYLFVSLPRLTQFRFWIWTALGAVVYVLYGYRRSPLGK
jgi:APA family basic amino acid/polyamine antiporter